MGKSTLSIATANPYITMQVRNCIVDGYQIRVIRTDEDHYEAVVVIGDSYHILRTDAQGNTVAFFSLGAPPTEEGKVGKFPHPSNRLRVAMHEAVDQAIASASRT